MKMKPQRWRSFDKMCQALQQQANQPLNQAITNLMCSYDSASLPLEVIVSVDSKVVMLFALDYEEGHAQPLVMERWCWVIPGQVIRGNPWIWCIDANMHTEQVHMADCLDMSLNQAM